MIKTKSVLRLFLLVVLVIAFSFSLNNSLFAATTKNDKALAARAKGYKLQKIGKWAEAETFYKKAISIDPNYATPYNDLGIVYEHKNLLDEAEKSYLKALKIRSDYEGVYTNLAALYEKKGDIKRAIAYWETRAGLGDTTRAWNKKALEQAKRLKAESLNVSLAQSKPKAEVVAPSSYLGYSDKINNNQPKASKNNDYDKFLSERDNVMDSLLASQSTTATKSREREVVVKKASQIKKEKMEKRSKKRKLKKLVSNAKKAIYEDRYQDALDDLYEAKDMSSKDKFLDELINEARSSSIDFEMLRASANADLYKKAQLLEVENAWYPPVSEPQPIVGYAEQFKGLNKSKDRLELETKAMKIIPSIDFTEARLKDVVEFLAVSNEINIVVDETVVPRSETVTIHLKNIPLKEALDIILRTKGLKYRFEDNIIWITTEEKLMEEDLVVRVYDVQDLVGKLFDFPSVPFDFAQMAASVDESADN